MKRKLLYVAAAALMLMLAACGNSKNKDTGASAGENAETEAFTSDTIITGTTFMGESLDGKTYAEACGIVNSAVEKLNNAVIVMHADGHEDICVKISDLPVYTIDGVNAKAMMKANTQEGTTSTIKLVISVDQSSIQSTLQEMADSQWGSVPAENASYGVSDGRVVLLSEASTGYSYDISSGLQTVCDQLLAGDLESTYYIDAQEGVTQPVLLGDKIGTFSVIGTYTTSYKITDSEVSQNRLKNVTASAEHMNGTVVAPNHEATALTMYGTISEENGYASAGTMSDGTHIDELGGGICQTTTTLYNALLFAELEIVARNNHSMLVNYVPASRDAMVYAQGGMDFVFKNTTSDYVVINSYVTNDYEAGCGTVTVNLIGLEEDAPDHTVEYETEILTCEMPEINNIVDDTRPIGWQDMENKVEVIESSDSYSPAVTSRLWKITTDNGVETRTLFTDTDTYKASYGGGFYVSPDVRVVAENSDDPDDYQDLYLKYNVYFIDNETLMSVDYIAWTDEERAAFNEKMTELLEADGYTWPYTGSEYETGQAEE